MKKLLVLVPCFVVVLALSKASFAQDAALVPSEAPVVAAEAVVPPPVPFAYPPYPAYPPFAARCAPCGPHVPQAMPCMVPAGCPYGCHPVPEQKGRFAARRAARLAQQPAPFQYPPPYQFPTPYPIPAAAPMPGAFPAPAAPAPMFAGGYYPPQPITTTTAGKNALQRSGAPIVINFMSLFRSPRTTQYDPYAGYYPPYPAYQYPYAAPAFMPMPQ